MRRATANDAADVARLVGCLLAELGTRVPPGDPRTSAALAQRIIASPRHAVFVATDAGAAVGVVTLGEAIALHAGGSFAWIDELYVVPEHRTRGIGGRLLGAAVGYGRAAGWSRIDVGTPPSETHGRTHAFYLRNAFVDVGPRMKRLL